MLLKVAVTMGLRWKNYQTISTKHFIHLFPAMRSVSKAYDRTIGRPTFRRHNHKEIWILPVGNIDPSRAHALAIIDVVTGQPCSQQLIDKEPSPIIRRLKSAKALAAATAERVQTRPAQAVRIRRFIASPPRRVPFAAARRSSTP